ncbi:MAG TPA: methionine aminotransferase [Candidatus Kapabacteria bacterium]|nr:methionine aminotransferase [Candidatus Kapabacteria bacterium]HPO64148.1 methionine aminotransferase [Candidatus Kapabacteria bacterium]
MKNFEANRILKMKTSIFATMSQLAIKHKAVNLGQGFPDFDGPAWIMEEAYKAMKNGKNQYAPMNGTLTFRKAISNVYKNYYSLDFNTDTEITVTAGATEALYSTFNAFFEEGDEVILFEPYYDGYYADLLLSGATPKFITLHKPDFLFDFFELEAHITQKTKAIVLNNPHNPTGKVWTLEELNLIAKLAKRYDLLVISDEVYEFLTFDNVQHIPFATLPEMKERTVTISSMGKTFGMTGWKIGYAVAPPNLTAAIQKIHQWTAFAVNTPGQHSMAYALSQLENYLPEFRKLYQNKRDFLFNELKTTKFKPHLPKGSYFIMVDIPAEKQIDDIKCAMELVEKNGVATIPPSVFYSKSDEGKTMLRLCFAKKDEVLLAGIERLKEY